MNKSEELLPCPDLELVVCRSFDGRTCIYLDDRRIAGGKPAIGKNVIDTWKVKRSELEEILSRSGEKQ